MIEFAHQFDRSRVSWCRGCCQHAMLIGLSADLLKRRFAFISSRSPPITRLAVQRVHVEYPELMFCALIGLAKQKASILQECADNLHDTLCAVRQAVIGSMRIGFAAPTWLHVRLVLAIVVEMDRMPEKYRALKCGYAAHVSDVLTQLANRFDETPWSELPAELLDSVAESYYQLGISEEKTN